MAGDQTIEGTKLDEHEVVLTIPARPEFLRLARMAAADVGSRCGLAYEEVDDLRIAVDELSHAIMGASEGATAPGTLEIRFTVLPDGVVIEASCLSDADPDLNELSAAILTAVVDEHELSRSGGTNSFRMVKRVRIR